MGRITSDSIFDAIKQVGVNSDCDAVFVSCTSLRALKIIPAAEAAIGKPVISSNQVLAWHMLRLAGISDQIQNTGHLFIK